ncbi:hypothetical protein EPUS_09146 [Endocarpon pusillum Z07020]|uniref:2-dehydropantoate 2-reductase n=1 Tax=Endocarpon pusillum (strain Z07020 / HMAS-L-300199) TaxID=1263415 RepID=U1GGA1_ENDPU|nr:uncharacterized protein EPUS_09146 [Endocarpon pusillum Z07020]ERF71123.1 hypothetical protein EPUS_09146 [Endocarpon pusillum Z07020]
MHKRPLEILIFGAGAVGSTFGWRLAQNPFVRLSAVCRSNYTSVKTNGIHLRTTLWGNGSFRPHRVVKAVSDVQNVAFDYVVCANKLTPSDAVSFAEAIRPAVRPTTTLVSVQNGINVERPLKHMFEGNTILSAICYASCQQPLPGQVQQLTQIRPFAFAIGTYHSGSTDTQSENNKLEKLVSLDSKFKAIKDVNTERWTKMMFNGSLNPVSALTGLNSHQLLQDSPSLTLAHRLAEEIYEVASRSGANLPADSVSRTISCLQSPAPIVPSMLQDARDGRQMEVEALCGNIWRQADAVGVSVPAVKATYDALTSMNQKIGIPRQYTFESDPHTPVADLSTDLASETSRRASKHLLYDVQPSITPVAA